MRFLCVLFLLACVDSAWAQETVNHSQALKVIPFNLLDYMPGSCDLGQVFVRKDQTPGQNLYFCGSANDWHLIGGNGLANETNYLFNFPIQFQGSPPDGSALLFNAAKQAWIPATVPAWKKYIVSYAATASSGLTNAVPLFTLVPRQKLCGLSIYVVTPFAGPTLKTATVSVGDSLDKKTTTTYTASAFSITALAGQDYNVFGSIYPGNGIVQATITVTGATLNELTAGVLEVNVCTEQLP